MNIIRALLSDVKDLLTYILIAVVVLPFLCGAVYLLSFVFPGTDMTKMAVSIVFGSAILCAGIPLWMASHGIR